MIEQALHALWVQTLVLSMAVVFIGCVRRAVARRFGAGAAYLAWALVPVAGLTAALPHRAQEAALMPAAFVQRVAAWPAVVPALQSVGGVGTAALLFAGWASIVALLVAAVAWRQRRFHALVARSGRLPAGIGPAVLGIVWLRVVLPEDFESRFDATERALMLAHEAVHLRRRDNAWNLIACAVVVTHWFNPLAWLAWRWMRFDQELSCDAAVLGTVPSAADPRRVQAYAAALLKVQGIALRPILATSWQSTHPLVERVSMLNRHALSSRSLRTGRRLVALAILAAGAVSYASQPPAPARAGSYTTYLDDGRISTQVTLAIDGLPPRYTEVDGAKDRRIRFQAQPEVGLADWFSLHIDVTPLDGERALISSVIIDEKTAQVLGKPAVIARMNEAARVELGDVADHHAVAISYVPRPSGYVSPGADTPAPPTPAALADKPSVTTAIDITDTTHAAAASGTSTKTVVHSSFSVTAPLGEQALVRLSEGAHQDPRDASLEMGLTVSRLEGDRLQVDARVSGRAPPAALGTPRIVVRDGERADVLIASDDGSHEVAISLQPRVVTASTPALPASPAPPQRAP